MNFLLMPGGIFMNFADKEKQRFSLRKLSIGVCSVLLGTTIYMANTEVAQADLVSDTNSQNTQSQVQKQTNQNNSNQVVLNTTKQLGGGN